MLTNSSSSSKASATASTVTVVSAKAVIVPISALSWALKTSPTAKAFFALVPSTVNAVEVVLAAWFSPWFKSTPVPKSGAPDTDKTPIHILPLLPTPSKLILPSVFTTLEGSITKSSSWLPSVLSGEDTFITSKALAVPVTLYTPTKCL